MREFSHLSAPPEGATGPGRTGTSTSHTLLDTRRGRVYRRVLLVAAILSIVGIADAARALFWLILNGTAGAEDPLTDVLKVGLRLVAWSLVAITAYTGWRRNVVPATWMLITLVVLCWALLLAQRYT